MNSLKNKHPFISNMIISFMSFIVIGYAMSLLQLFYTEVGLGSWFGVYEELLTDWDSNNILGLFIDIVHAIFGIINTIILMLIFVLVGYKRLVPFKEKYKNFISIWVTALASFLFIIALFYRQYGSLNFNHINIQLFCEQHFLFIPTAYNFEWFAVYDFPRFLSDNFFVLIFVSIIPSFLLSIGLLLNIKDKKLNEQKIGLFIKKVKLILLSEFIISVIPLLLFGVFALYSNFQ